MNIAKELLGGLVVIFMGGFVIVSLSHEDAHTRRFMIETRSAVAEIEEE